MSINESIIKDASLGWFGEMGYAIGHGVHMAPSELVAERAQVSRHRSSRRIEAGPSRSSHPVWHSAADRENHD